MRLLARMPAGVRRQCARVTRGQVLKPLLIRRYWRIRRRPKLRRGPDRSPAYLVWIRSLGCAVCGKGRAEQVRIEAAHTGALGPRGLSQKSSDFSAIPLCFWDHVAGPNSYHRLGERRFAAKYALDLPALVSRLNARYRELVEYSIGQR